MTNITRSVSFKRIHSPQDCKHCLYLGSNDTNDYYFCTRDQTPIARYGNSPEEYMSGLALIGHSVHLRAAFTLAMHLYPERVEQRTKESALTYLLGLN